MPHLVLALTPHGYGHTALTAPIINRLRRHLPDLRLTIQTDLPRRFLETRFEGEFAQERGGRDFGLRMHSAMAVDVEASAAEYRALHGELPVLIEQGAARLSEIGADLLVTSISYIAIAAAKRAGIPAVGISSLNWADIYGAYLDDAAIEAEMLDCYGQADLILRPAPAMPMERLANTRAIGPVAMRGRNRRDELPQDTKIGLIAFGGMASGLDISRWPKIPGWRWAAEERHQRDDVLCWADMDMPMVDLLASADLVISKPGYGTFTECALSGRPLIYARRDDWPESPYLDAWVRQHTRSLGVPMDALTDGSLPELIERLFAQPERPPAEARGIAEGAEILAAMLEKRSLLWTSA